MSNGFLSDSAGDLSSKRLWGSIILGASGIMALALFIVCIYRHDNETAIRIISDGFICGASLLGIGIAENIPFFKGKNND
jgi:hypothetical protein